MLMISGASARGSSVAPAGLGHAGAPEAPGASRAWLWPVGLVALLCGSIAICVATAVIAASDRSVALEPDYYAQAAAWDESAREREASRALGWTVGAEVSEPASVGAARTLRVRVDDADGRPVPADRVEVVAFHHARSQDRVTLGVGTGGVSAPSGVGAVVEASPGRWAWSLGEARAGVWQVRVRVVRGRDVFVARLDVETPDGGR